MTRQSLPSTIVFSIFGRGPHILMKPDTTTFNRHFYSKFDTVTIQFESNNYSFQITRQSLYIFDRHFLEFLDMDATYLFCI